MIILNRGGLQDEAHDRVSQGITMTRGEGAERREREREGGRGHYTAAS
jgi:hypothetical protein